MARNKTDNKFYYNGWKGSSSNYVLMKSILEKIEVSPTDIFFKQKENRTVFKFQDNTKIYFAKENIVNSAIERIRELFRSKSKAEYKIGKKLESVSSPVVKTIGWGKKGNKNLLVTQSPDGSVTTLKEFLTNLDSLPDKKREQFIHALIKFINDFISTRIQHPDFHFGNVLVVENNDDIEVLLVDLYGIKFRFGPFNIFKSGMWLFLIVLNKVLRKFEIISILKSTNLINSAEEYKNLIRHILLYEISYTYSLWKGRKKKILDGTNSRYSKQIYLENGSVFYLRKDVDFKVETMLGDKKQMIALSLSREIAQRMYLASIYLETQEIPHCKTVAWKKSKLESQEDVIFVEKKEEWSDLMSLSEVGDELIIRCREVLGRGFYNDLDSFVREKDGKIILIDYANIERV